MPQTKNINLVPGVGPTQVINVSQNDVGREILLNLKDNSDWYDLTGCTVTLAGTKPSGLGYTVAGTIDGHQVTIVTTKQMTDEYGSIASELKIASGNNIIGTANVILSVEKDPHPDGTTDGSIDTLIPELTLLVERVETAAADAAEAQRKAEDAQEAAETAQGKAEDAQEAAETAQGKAEDAQEAAETAQGKAEDAQEAAETAQGRSEAAAESAEQLIGDLATEETQLLIEGETEEITGLLEQIIEQGHSSGDLNGYSLNPGPHDSIQITYTDPEDEESTATITAITDTTAQGIADMLGDLADIWKAACNEQ